MTDLLLRLFVRNSDLEDPVVRGTCGSLAGIVGILCNVMLFAAKLLIGILSGSVSITADAVNNLSDASSSVVTLVGFRLAQKPADAEHPYGHARMEYLSGLAVAAMILVIGTGLAKSSFLKILHPEPVGFSGVLVAVLVLSISLKLWLMGFYRGLGHKIASQTLIAAAADSRNDVISTAAVLLSAIIAHLTGWALDGYIGFLVALFILCSGVNIARDTVDPLLGHQADTALAETVRQEVLNWDERILGVHDLMVHDYGPGQTFASIHVEADRNRDVMEMHELIDSIERAFLERRRIHLTIHYDPVVTDDAETDRLRVRLAEILNNIDPQLQFHDLRVMPGPSCTRLFFDVALPFDLCGKQSELQTKLEAALREPETQYELHITFDLC